MEIQRDSSTANSLTERLGVGPETKHIDTRYFWVQERVQDGDLSIKKVPTAKKVQFWNESLLLTMDPTLGIGYVVTVEELSTWHEKRWTRTGEERRRREREANSVSTYWSHFGDYFTEPTTGTSTR